MIKGIDTIRETVICPTKKEKIEVKAITWLEMLLESQRWLDDKGVRRGWKIHATFCATFFLLEKERIYTTAVQQATLAILPLKGTDHPL
ncbi:MAG: hypothetical protein AB1611_06080 [bacterium]